MKIGILTHHYVKNFGAYMQAKGLISVISKNYPDITVELIDYRVELHEKLTARHFFGFKPRRGDTILGYIQKIRLLFTHKKYENELPKSKRVYTAEDINALNYNLIIVGSDEVWNYNDIAYSPLKFGYGIKSPLITYSASVGGSTLNDSFIPAEVKTGIEKFIDIAVRDEKTEDCVKCLNGRTAVRTLDPVYLYDYTLVTREKVRRWVDNKPYILIYDCCLGMEQKEAIIKFAQRMNWNILGAGEYRNWYTTTDTVDITPYEWAYLFKNAEVVVTGTFHGTSFSIKYNRPFIAYLTEQNRINKVESLLAEFNLKERIVNCSLDISTMLAKKIDYESVNRNIEERKKVSLDYILKNIDSIVLE